MPEDATGPPASPESAFQQYERPLRVRNYKLGAVLAGITMPGGATLDYYTHGWDTMVTLLPNRVICAVLLGAIWTELHLHPETKRYRLLGFLVALLPLLSIAWMIYDLGGATSTYYAGLNLILVGSAILLRWTLADSVIIVVLTLVFYLLVCLLRGPVGDSGIFFNNIYFLVVTGVFLIAGSWYYNGVRRSEFDLRWRLDQNRAELEASNRKLRELDELKGRFFANISHELRTPLTLLIAPLETLLNRSVPLPVQEEKDLLSTMHGNSMRLLKLINDLLDLVRMEAGTMQINLRELDVDGFVQGLANAVRPVAQDKRVRIDTHVDDDIGVVMVDPEKAERICLNLLFNAIKFTAAGGFVEFSAIRDGEWLALEVRDTGMGISPENLPHLFTRFFQADTSSQRKFQGMGIGLALVKELAEVQGGSVSAASELGKGTVMTVKIPYKAIEKKSAEEQQREDEQGEKAPPPAEEAQEWISTLYRRAEMFPAMTSLQATIKPVETGASRGHKPMLLIADDEPDMLRFLRGQLSASFEVIEAVDGRQAVEKAAQFLPEIILTDMMMPEMDGLQVCRELRSRSSTRSIPVVLLTARADEHTKIECLAAGASDFLAKPFSMTEVNVRLKNLVDSHTYQRELAQQKQQLEAAIEQIKETESLLLRNEKLASLGRMSAGLIHEINNPLNYARQGLHLLGQNTPLLPEDARAEFADTLKDVEEGVNRVVRIISDLRGFTRTTNETNQVFEIKQLAEKTLRFFSHEWKDGIRHETDVPDGLEMRGDPNHIVQVLVNLIQNAIDAMRTKTYPEGESACISIIGTRDHSRVQIKVRDNGPGVPQEIRHQIFDPFFTTKDVGAGMGLGLAICHRVIAEHEGRIDLRSEPGSFTEFILEFPSPDTIVENYNSIP